MGLIWLAMVASTPAVCGAETVAGASGPQHPSASAHAASSDAQHPSANPHATEPESEPPGTVASAWRDSLPAGSVVLEFENLEGVILLRARLEGENGRDTTTTLALDTGAGWLALDQELALALGVADSSADQESIDFASRSLARLELGKMQIDQVAPVLTFDARVVGEVTDRPVGGLLGERVLAGHALAIDYQHHVLALIPTPRPQHAEANAGSLAVESRHALRGAFGPRAIPIAFELAGDGKILVQVRVSNPEPPDLSPRMTLVLDTGATKCVLFEEAVEDMVTGSDTWSSLRGLAAPTLFGTSKARLVRVPLLEVEGMNGTASQEGVDIAIIHSELAEILSRVVGEPVYGLLGYSFLRNYRVAIDYVRRIVWLDPIPGGWNDQPYEYSHIGLQLGREEDAIQVLAVAEDSPAAKAGIVPGDVVVSMNGKPASDFDVVTLSRKLEGPPGTTVRITLRRGDRQRSYKLTRKRLL